MLNASSNETAGDVRSSWRSIDWLSAYPPGASKDLAVHAAKVSAVKKWITDATAEHAAFEQNRSSHLCSDDCFRPYVLVLCGRSGCGKSTMVEVLCRELNVEVAQWSDDMIDVDSVQKGAPWDRPTLPTPTLAGSMAEWARGVTFPSLDIRSTGVSAESTEKEKFGIGRRFAYKNHRESKTLSKLILMHSPPFQNSKRSGSDDCGDLLQSVAFPVVIVLSEVGGADDMAFAADRALGLSPAQKNRYFLPLS